jgi:hypothetical protein
LGRFKNRARRKATFFFLPGVDSAEGSFGHVLDGDKNAAGRQRPSQSLAKSSRVRLIHFSSRFALRTSFDLAVHPGHLRCQVGVADHQLPYKYAQSFARKP